MTWQDQARTAEAQRERMLLEKRPQTVSDILAHTPEIVQREYNELAAKLEAMRLDRDRILAELVDLQDAPNATCHWNEDDSGAWYSQCGHVFRAETDPADHHFTHCPYCGHRLSWSAYDESGEDAPKGES